MLKQKYYDAVVVSDEIDPNHAGAVRARIIGVTDTLDDSDQPFVLPVVNSFTAVPTKGTYLRVEFDDGDIHKGRYTHVSVDTSALPKEYVDNYPNVAVTNLGSDTFKMYHNRLSRETLIEHDSQSRINWDSDGVITHDSDLAYGNTGYGAKDGRGQKIQSVLTGGTIDVFCATPFSSSQGSEYFRVPHVSKRTVLQPVTPTADVTDTSVLEVGQTRPLLNGEVEFDQSPTKIQVSSREVYYVIATCSGGFDMISVYNDIMNPDKNISYHYVIGTEPADVIIEETQNILSSVQNALPGSSRDADSETNPRGFTQFVELSDVAAFGSSAINPDDPNAGSINMKCISVCLIGDGGNPLIPTTGFTDFQYQKLNDILNHVKNEFGNDVVFITPDDVDFNPPINMGNFDYTRI